jgi:hypothetical protein
MTPTAADVLFRDTDRPADDLARAAKANRNPDMHRIPTGLHNQVSDGIGEWTRVPLADVLVRSWVRQPAIADAVARPLSERPDRDVFEFGRHVCSARYRAQVDVTVNHASYPLFDVVLEIEATIVAATVIISDDQITAQPGPVMVRVSLATGPHDGMTLSLLSRETKPISFGRISGSVRGLLGHRQALSLQR